MNMTRANNRARKAQQKLYEIERLVRITSETKDKRIKALMKERLFKMMEEKL